MIDYGFAILPDTDDMDMGEYEAWIESLEGTEDEDYEDDGSELLGF